MGWRPYAGFFPRRVAGSAVLEEDILGAAQQAVKDLGAVAVGEAVFDLTGTGLGITVGAGAINERRLTITGDLPALTGEGVSFLNAGSDSDLQTVTDGARTYTIHDPEWYTSLPYEDDNGTTYRVYLHSTSFPVDVGVGVDGSRGYARWVDAPGIDVIPDSVVDTGTGLRFIITSIIADYGIQAWLTSNDNDENWSYDVVVWLDTDVSGTKIATNDPDVAIGLGKMVKRTTGGAGWWVTLDNYLGQGTPSLTAGRYRIAILGPVITTTDFDSDDGYTHIGTVAAAPVETVSTAGQRIVRSMSDIAVGIEGTISDLFEKGWITLPTVTPSGANVPVASGGVVFVNGFETTDGGGATLTTLGSSQVEYVYWNSTTEEYLNSASWNTANGGGNVPVYRYETDGSSDFIADSGFYIGRLWGKHTNAGVITVSGVSAHGAQFTTLGGALAHLAGMRAGSAAIERAVIELSGDVTVTATIELASMVAVEGLTIRGGGGGIVRPGAGGTVGVKGGRIIWNFDGSLFSIPSGTTLKNWRFEGITFRFEDAGASSPSIVDVVGSVRGLGFHGCIVDGSVAYSGQGGASGKLAHMVRGGGSANIKDLVIEDCYIATHDAAVFNGSTVGLQHVVLRRNKAVGPDEVPTVSGAGGFVVDNGTGSVRWSISENDVSTANGRCISTKDINGLFVHDNYFNTSGTYAVVSIGEDQSVCRALSFHDNVFEQTASGTPDPMVIFDVADDGTILSAISVHDNAFIGNDTASSIALSAPNTLDPGNTRTGYVVHDNVIYGARKGLVVSALTSSVIHSNVISATSEGIEAFNINEGLIVALNHCDAKDPIQVDPGTSSIVVGNNAVCTDTVGGGTALFIGDTEGRGAVVASNVIRSRATVAANLFEAADPTYMIVSGNLISAVGATGDQQVSISGDASTFIGNLMVQAVFSQTVNENLLLFIGNIAYGGSVAHVGAYLIGDLYFTNSITMENTPVVIGSMLGLDTGATALTVDDTVDMVMVGVALLGNMTHDGTGSLTIVGSTFGTVTESGTGPVKVIGSELGGLANASGTTGVTVIGATVGSAFTDSSTAGKLVAVATTFGGTVTLNDEDDQRLVACDMTTVVDDAGGANARIMIVGCRLTGGAITLHSDDLVVVGNWFNDALTLTSAVNNSCVVANRITGGLSDSSTSSTVASNE